MSNKKMEFNNDEAWLQKMIEAEDSVGGNVSAGSPDALPPLVGVEDFVRRQSEESEYTHFDGTWEELCKMTDDAMRDMNFENSYREGVYVVHLPKEVAGRFYTFTDYDMFEGMNLQAEYKREAGREHEPPRVKVQILEDKLPCKYVDIILYAAHVLAEDEPDKVRPFCLGIVSINGRRRKKAAPMDPLTIVRNWKHLPGGTEMKGKSPKDVLEMLCQSIMHKNGIKGK